ncbi:MAG: radical SAM protein [Candidatus Binataceae bacterium]
MKFELDAVFIEERYRDSALAARVLDALPPSVPVSYIDDGREAARPLNGIDDVFAAGKRRLIVMGRRSPFLMACPAASAGFACCGYLVLTLASNCPMDCSYCFLQEYLADNPGFQVYANYADCFDELFRLTTAAPGRHFRVGTGELADSLAFDSITGIGRAMVEFFAGQENLLLEFKTKTDEIGGLLRIDPKARTLVSWTLSPEAVFRSSERLTAPPARRIQAAQKAREAGYKIAFHFDPIIAYPGAEADYLALLDELFDTVAPEHIAFISLGGLRITPGLRKIVRRRFPGDPMMVGEDVLSPDGRYRAFTPLRLRLYRLLDERIRKARADTAVYLCMEPASVHERVFGAPPLSPGTVGESLAGPRT